MTKAQVRETIESLEAIYGKPRMINRFDPMDELVSCILSQHTSDANSFPTFTRLKEAYPEWQDLLDAGRENVANTIRSAGLANQKSKSIVECLEQIKQKTGGFSLDFLRDLPMVEARAWLMDLPGVGPKTASIVLCFSLGMEAIPVDTHVFRVSWRLGIIDQAIGESKAHDALLKVVPEGFSFRLHTSFIQHGRMTCKAPLPICESCVLSDRCNWYKVGGPEKRRNELMRGRKNTRAKA